MQVFATFINSTYLEMAITLLEEEGFKKEQIFAVPLDKRREAPKLFDTLNHSDGVSVIDIGMALSTAFAVVGASVGFSLAWGPIYWGLIAAVFGFLLGVAIKLFVFQGITKRRNLIKNTHGEVILIVDCNEKRVDQVEHILWDHNAVGVAKVR